MKRNRFVTLTGARKAGTRALEARVRARSGIKSWVSNLNDPTPEHVIAGHTALLNVEE